MTQSNKCQHNACRKHIKQYTTVGTTQEKSHKAHHIATHDTQPTAAHATKRLTKTRHNMARNNAEHDNSTSHVSTTHHHGRAPMSTRKNDARCIGRRLRNNRGMIVQWRRGLRSNTKAASLSVQSSHRMRDQSFEEPAMGHVYSFSVPNLRRSRTMSG